MFKIDSIKYKARSFARRHEGDAYNINPFARWSSRTLAPPIDEEQGLRRSVSEGFFQSSQESDRIRDNRKEEHDFGVPHANTAPPVSAISPTPPRDFQSPQIPEGEPSSDANGDLATPNTVPDDEKSHPRRRFKLLGKGKGEKEMEHTSTTDTKKSRTPPKITVWSQIRATVFGSYINVLLVIVPVGFAVNYAHINGVAIFVVNFIAIIPLAGMLSYATEELALRVGETLGGLLNATFG